MNSKKKWYQIWCSVILLVAISQHSASCQNSQANEGAAALRGPLPGNSADEDADDTKTVGETAPDKTNIGEDKKADNESKATPLDTANLKMTVEKTDLRRNGLYGLQIKIFNGSDRAVIFDGDKISAKLDGKQYACLGIAQVEDKICRGPNAAVKVASGLSSYLTVGAAPTIRDQIKHRAPVLDRYGMDETRRESEVSRFGKRILWPGDSSEGIVYFKVRVRKGSIAMPANTLYDSQDKAELSSSLP